ncbi:uncharacterized protein LOC142538311 [Primulina tabacum]|uniref:uncharacterized protein LOC142538311 n=1 Tax=Primulina tabacum TaxID=48773 RepID=UPI003F5A726D
MSKAYDPVEWCFLEEMMIRLGFAPAWVEKIMRCVSSVRYSFSLNGELVVNISPNRGLRKGDPLSPYFFVLCAHGLSSALISLENRRLLSGVRIASSCPPISHLFFADDSLLFFRATLEDCMMVRNCLELYERASGQLINFEKSSLSFSSNTNEQVCDQIKSALAIPSSAGIQGWGNKFFSAGGKETLIKSVLQAIPTYAMSYFRIPKSICEEIERECANFWWGKEEGRRRLHWKKWRDLCKPKCQGVWRIITKPGSLVARVLKARSLLEKGLCWKVGDGSKIPTFGEHWIPGTRDCVSPPPESEHFARVSTLLDRESWNEPLIHNLFPPHLVKDILAIPLSQSQKEDFRFWSYDPKGKYSVSDGYKVAIGFFDSPPSCSSNHSIEWWRFIWSLSIPPKHTHRYSIGGVIRNHEGQPVLVFRNKTEKPSSVLYAELLAILKRLNMFSTHNLRLHHISSDSLLTLQEVLLEEENFSYAGALTLDIRRLLALQGSPTLSHAWRSANCVAYAIASFASSSHSPFV